jgi:predicted RNA binding protein YcfA (HicA-like mRNA interferase family)
MAVDDLSTLRSQLPEAFADVQPPEGWDDDWFMIPIEEPEKGVLNQDTLSQASNAGTMGMESEVLDQRSTVSDRVGLDLGDSFGVPDFGKFPGGPSMGKGGGSYPPPDAFAFYLPFHYFYPKWWGVYLVLEPTLKLAEFVRSHASGVLSSKDSLTATRIFLYAHEAFHHIVESFGTRLEISHRRPLFKEGFDRLYRRTYGSDVCMEEAIATAHGLRRVKEKAFPGNKGKTGAALKALRKFVEGCPPGYRRASEFIANTNFLRARDEFAEDNHREALALAPKAPGIWTTFPHAFSGISRVTSRVNYIVRKDSSLATRLNLNLRYLRYRDLRQKLIELGGCRYVREGKGGHEIWQSRAGHRFPVPRHPGDLRQGTLAKIIKEAGLDMSISEFMAAGA